jgi:hypothetical protein
VVDGAGDGDLERGEKLRNDSSQGPAILCGALFLIQKLRRVGQKGDCYLINCIFPTRVGVNRRLHVAHSPAKHIPHACGGEPTA